MASTNQINANRLNSKKSTGPKSPGGLERSSANALKHGLSAKAFVIHGEDASEFEKLRKRFVKDWHPKGATEWAEVRRLAETHWQLRRAQLAITELLDAEIYESGSALLSRLNYARTVGPNGLGHVPGARPVSDTNEGSPKDATDRSEEICKKKLRDLTYGVGAALSHLGPKDQKLGTVLRYKAHLEQTAERIVRNLLYLQKHRAGSEG
jgi:hypothetical protein